MYDCSYCGLSLTRWGSYIEHVGTVHEAEGGTGTEHINVENAIKSS
jgi:hypothetical protein